MRMFALLQQLQLTSSSRLFPTIGSFIPFTVGSPLMFLMPTSAPSSIAFSLWTAFKYTLPFLCILLHGKAKFFVSHILYRPIYKALPRPTGSSMFEGLSLPPPTMEYDTPDRPTPRASQPVEDGPTLRALEGLPSLARSETHPRPTERDSDSSADDTELAHATLISFDVETDNVNGGQSQSMEGTLGQWSAELRSSNEQPPGEIKYRVTGLTMLPTIMATESLREIAAGIVVMPFEALMVRCIGRMYRASAQSGAGDMYTWHSGFGGLGGLSNILSALALQLGFSSIVWAGFTVISQWATKKRVGKAKDKDAGAAGSSAQVSTEDQ